MAGSNFIVRGGADFSGITKALNKTQTQLTGFQDKISRSMKAIGTVLGSLAVGKLIKDSTSMAMSVESAVGNISRNMGSASIAFNAWAQTQSKAWGMAKADAYKYGSTFSNLLASFSGSAQETADNTQELMQAAAIIASKTGRSYQDTAERIRSGMLGSTEAIEDLGVYTNIAMIESTDAFKKFANGKSWSQLNFQVQQQIRLAAILEQTYARYGETLADNTQTRQAQFIASLKNIQLNIGQAFLPIYNAVLPVLTALSNKLEEVTSKLKYFTQAIFGKAVVGPVAQVEEQAAAVAGIGDAAEATGDKTAAAAKKAKGALAGFDELNLLTGNKGGDTGGTSFGGSGGADSNEEFGADTSISPALQATIDTFVGLLEPLKSINFDNATAAFDRLKEAVAPITATLFEGLQWAYLNIFVPLEKWTIEDVLPAFLDLLSSAIKVLSAALDALKPLAMWLWENFLWPIAEWTGGLIISTLESIAGALSKVSDWIKNNQELLISITAAVGAFLIAWQVSSLIPVIGSFFSVIGSGISIVSSFIAGAGGLGAALASLINPVVLVAAAIAALVAYIVYAYQTNEEFRETIDELWKSIRKNLISTIEQLGQILATVWTTALKPIWDTFMQTVDWLWSEHLKPLLDNFLDLVGEFVLGALQIINEFILPIVSAFVETFGPTIANVFQTAVSILGSFLGAAADVMSGVITVIKGIVQFLTGVFTGDWGKAWEGIVNVFKGIFESIGGIVKGVINVVIDLINSMLRSLETGLNWVIEKIDGLIAKVNSVAGAVGLPTFNPIGPISLGSIPKLARGGIVDSPTLAMIGEAGKEAVIPLENTAFVDTLASAIGTAVLSAMQFSQSGNSTPQQAEAVFNLDGSQFARAIVPLINKETRRVGNMAIIQGV
ncbi:MAG TPA: hypothetical protein GX523_17285 [Desulfitobacterium dehalogenans]|uniref:Phage-related protein n=1 Tax=Desulfitobacterium dehalogenans TaxID=36854 RepID=A0A7C7D7W8_9FIRM|nr:hypothetical protein [Desulfitobacterium dehalogenans]